MSYIRDSILEDNLSPLEGYIENGQFDEAYQALHNILVNCIQYANQNAKSDSYHIDENEAESLGWNGSSLYSILTSIKELGGRIDIEKNMKCAAYAACKLYNELFKENTTLLYKLYAEENSVV